VDNLRSFITHASISRSTHSKSYRDSDSGDGIITENKKIIKLLRRQTPSPPVVGDGMFSRATDPRRCVIPDCDAPDPAGRVYEPDWLRFTTPYKEDTGLPRKCQRYAARTSPGNRTRCAPQGFDGNAMIPCDGHWVFEDPENTVGTEVSTDVGRARDRDRGSAVIR